MALRRCCTRLVHTAMKTQKPHTRAFDLDAATAAGALARLVHKLFVAVRVSCACLVLSGREPSVSQLQHKVSQFYLRVITVGTSLAVAVAVLCRSGA
jgi:hypothetical protein